MSASAWDRLFDWMVAVALFVDEMKLWILCTLSLAVFLWLLAWFFKVLNPSSASLCGDDSDDLSTPTLLERLDERACIVISRRPRTRKRRHRHRRHRHTALVAV